MRKNTMKRRALSVSLGLAGLALMARPGQANIIGSYVENGDGTVTYSYVVDNTGGSLNIVAWSLEFGFLPPDWDQLDVGVGGGVAVPNSNWIADAGVPVSGLSAQDFLSIDPTSDVLAGQSLGGFSFTSRFLPGPVAFFEFSEDGSSAGGTTTGPALAPVATVPEAGGGLVEVALMALGLFATAGRGAREHARPVIQAIQS